MNYKINEVCISSLDQQNCLKEGNFHLKDQNFTLTLSSILCMTYNWIKFNRINFNHLHQFQRKVQCLLLSLLCIYTFRHILHLGQKWFLRRVRLLRIFILTEYTSATEYIWPSAQQSHYFIIHYAPEHCKFYARARARVLENKN